MSKETILIVDDERDILELIDFNLKKEGYTTLTALTGEDALNQAGSGRPDLVILDLMLPGVDGIDVCRKLKQDERTREVPILMLTAKSEDSDVIAGLEVGADDYVTKPFSPKILIARVRAILRRARTSLPPGQQPARYRIHGIEIDVSRHEVSCNGKPVTLSVSEFSILDFLARSPGWVFSRSQIIAAVKGSDYPVTERSVDVQILGIRKKIGDQGRHIETVRGIGYRMRED